MALNKEQIQILTMLSENKISVEESVRLLEAIETNVEKDLNLSSKIVVNVWERGKETVNVRIPVSLAKVAWNLLPQDIKSEVDLQIILDQVEAGSIGQLIEIEQRENERKIEISLA